MSDLRSMRSHAKRWSSRGKVEQPTRELMSEALTITRRGVVMYDHKRIFATPAHSCAHTATPERAERLSNSMNGNVPKDRFGLPLRECLTSSPPSFEQTRAPSCRNRDERLSKNFASSQRTANDRLRRHRNPTRGWSISFVCSRVRQRGISFDLNMTSESRAAFPSKEAAE